MISFLLVLAVCFGYLTLSEATATQEISQKAECCLEGLDTHSLTTCIAYYDLYPKEQFVVDRINVLLQQAVRKLTGMHMKISCSDKELSSMYDVIQPISRKHRSGTALVCSEYLLNRGLTGSNIWTHQELLQLPTEEVDIARALLIEYFDDGEVDRDLILYYEKILDLMALEVAARLPFEASPEKVVE
jgi:hypothetical protein